MKIVLGLLTCLWAGILAAQIGKWSAEHTFPLEGRGIVLSLPPSAEWRAVHVLVEGCSCSRDVAGYLRARGPQSGWREEVWVLDGNSPAPISSFPVSTPTIETAQAAGLVGGPRLLLFSPGGSLVWSGGYSWRRPAQGQPNLDIAIMSAVQRGESPPQLPVFGCPRRNPV